MEEFPFITSAALGEEMKGAELGDKRLSDRCGELAETIAESPAEEFPQAVQDHAELEALYRFWRHPATGFQSLLEPHQAETARRVEDREGPMLAVHDTTCVELGEKFRPGLGRVEGGNRFGFYAHLTLAVEATGPKLPHGVLEGQLWRRSIPEQVPSDRREPSKDCLEQKDHENSRWLEGVGRVEDRVGEQEIIHVMDRDADSYDNLKRWLTEERRFVVRVNQNRSVANDVEGVDSPRLEDALREAPKLGEKTIELGRRDQTGRPPKPRKVHPSREARTARVELRARSVEICEPADRGRSDRETQTLQVVWVRELDPPEDGEAVDWRLYTSETVADEEDVEWILGIYQRRWVIEEYIGVLKGAFRIEQRQLESAETLTTALGVMVPAAWRLLAIRTMAQHAGEDRAEKWFRSSELVVLAEDERTDFDAPEDVNLREALWGVAALGGHLPRNGKPGWKVLHRGYFELKLRELGCRIGQVLGADAMRAKVDELAEQADSIEELQRRLAEIEPSNL